MIDPRLEPVLLAAVGRIQSAAQGAANRVVEMLGLSMMSASSNAQRQAMMAAQFDLRQKLSTFNQTFSRVLYERVTEELHRRAGGVSTRGGQSGPTDWAALSLVGDDEVESQVSADRLGLTLGAECEWELRDLAGYMATLLGLPGADQERNPLRPQNIGKALFRAIEAASDDVEARKVLARELGRALAASMRACYQSVLEDLRHRGVQPVGLAVRTTSEGRGDTRSAGLAAPGADAAATPSTRAADLGPAARQLSAMFGVAVPAGLDGAGSTASSWGASAPGAWGGPGGAGGPAAGGMPGGFGGSGPGGATGPGSAGVPGAGGGSAAAGWPTGTGTGGGTDGSTGSSSGPGNLHGSADSAAGGRPTGAGGPADTPLFDVIKRLAFLSAQPGGGAAGGAGGSAGVAGELADAAAWAASVPGGLAGEAGSGSPTAPGGISGPMTGAVGLGAIGGLMAVNLIRQHRDELMRASSGALDHMVIDIVAALFDQVLSDPKVPPQMARQIARLQLPVLRVALKDMGFFSSRKHPVRKLVNRIASLAASFDDFDDVPGKETLARVSALVQDIVEGEFDQMALYEEKLSELEAFIREQTTQAASEHADVSSILGGKEADLRIQQRYMRALQSQLGSLSLQDFLRDFLAQVWSQVQVLTLAQDGPDSERAQRMKRTARDLVMSVQPKGAPQLRKEFLLRLPGLMKDLNEGLDLIRWPEQAKKEFFAKLLPAHAESLKAAPLTDFARRQLEFQLDQVDKVAVPTREEVARDVAPVLLNEQSAGVVQFSSDEAQAAGLVEEAAIDWDGSVDIDLSGGEEPVSTVEVDINLDTPAPPTAGPQLVAHIQPGVAYQMYLNDAWKKVRLSWVSPGRTFFIFTYGRMYKQTISVTSRTLTKLCETGRFKAFEQAELIERATARARKQLAALGVGPASSSGPNSGLGASEWPEKTPA
ncbi:MAG: DUF1631 family protein [Burkholderiales bacterium]|nr:DUF1631 family protein [Burkholderiales bacterium]